MKRILLTVFILLFSFNIYCQVAIGAKEAHQSSVLEIKSAQKGVLIPRMTLIQRNNILNPAEALLIYQIDGENPGFYYNAGNSSLAIWRKVGDDANRKGDQQLFLNSGSDSFVVPNEVYRLYFEIAAGGGGAGGTYLNGVNSRGGGGGGGGGFAKGYIDVSPGEILNLIVGEKGSQGSDSNSSPEAGTDGGVSSIASGGITLIQVSGGRGGSPGGISVLGTGGIGGAINLLPSEKTHLSSLLSGSSVAGGSGIGGNGSTLSGQGGIVYSVGEYNLHSRFLAPVIGGSSVGTTTEILPRYGLGGGFSNGAFAGYLIFSW